MADGNTTPFGGIGSTGAGSMPSINTMFGGQGLQGNNQSMFSNWGNPYGNIFPQGGPSLGNLNSMQQYLNNPGQFNGMNLTGMGAGAGAGAGTNPFFNLFGQGSTLGNNATGGTSLGLTQPQSGGDVNTPSVPGTGSGSNIVGTPLTGGGSQFPNTNFTGVGAANPTAAPNNPFAGNPTWTTNGTSWAQTQGINAYPLTGGPGNGMLGAMPPSLFGGQGFGVAGQGPNGPNYFE